MTNTKKGSSYATFFSLHTTVNKNSPCSTHKPAGPQGECEGELRAFATLSAPPHILSLEPA